MAQRSRPWWPASEPWRRRGARTQDRHARTGSYLKKPTFSPKSTALPTLQTVGTWDLSVRPGPCGVGLTEQRVTRRGRRRSLASRTLLPVHGRRASGEGKEKRGKDQALPVAQRPACSAQRQPQGLGPGPSLRCGVTSAG